MRYKLNSVECGFLDNILYDFCNNVLPFDDFNNYKGEGLTFRELGDIRRYYNLSLKYGVDSVYYLKLCYVVCEIIFKYCTNYIGMIGYKDFKKGYF